MIGRTLLLVGLVALPLSAQDRALGTLSNAGVVRASAMVDSVFVDRQLRQGRIDGGDWASYLLARLGTGPIPDTLGIEVAVDSAGIEVRGRLDDLPPEARQLLGPLANMVAPSTPIVADVILQRTGPRVARFWLRGLEVNGFRFPELILGQMMAQVGRQYPALTKSGRDLYVEVPADGLISLGDGAVLLAVPAKPAGGTAGDPPPRTARP
jgi:hypothetical protein